MRKIIIILGVVIITIMTLTAQSCWETGGEKAGEVGVHAFDKGTEIGTGLWQGIKNTIQELRNE